MRWITVIFILLILSACTSPAQQIPVPEKEMNTTSEPENTTAPEEETGEQKTDSTTQERLDSAQRGNEVCKLQQLSKTQEVELDQNINSEFGTTIDADNLDGLYKGLWRANINDTTGDYAVHDQILLANSFRPETTLTLNEDDQFGDAIFIPVMTDAVRYYYIIEDTLKAGNRFSDATEAEPLTIPFLGQELTVIGATANTLTVIAPTKYRVRAGESIHLNGDTITLVQTGTTTATVEVNGEREVVQDTQQERINGIEIKVQDITNEEGLEYDEATIIAGIDAQTTAHDGEAFIGQDEDDPLWVWDIANLNTQTPTVGITFNKNIDTPEERPIQEGYQLCLPNHYVCFIYEQTNTDEYVTYELEPATTTLYASQAEAQNNTAEVSSARVLKFHAEEKGFTRNNEKFETMFLYHNGSSVRVYEQRENKAVFTTAVTGTATPFNLQYGNANVPLQIAQTLTTATMTLDFSVGSDLVIYFETENTNQITYLGHSQGNANTVNDFLYGTRDISGFTRDLRLGSGAILKDPESHQSSDDLMIEIPHRIDDFGIAIRAEVNRMVCS